MPKAFSNEYGCCPVCGMNDGYLSLGDEHWFHCWEHKKKWLFGAGWFEPIRYKGNLSAEEVLAACEAVRMRMVMEDDD